MSDRPLLSPNALVGGDDPVGRAMDYVKRLVGGSEDGVGDYIVLAINGATGRMERLTNRRLKSRTYRNTASISCGATLDSETLTGSGFLDLKVGDDAVGANLEAGSRIDSIESAGSLTLTKKARATGTAAVTFGSAPITVNGEGSSSIRIPEYPVSEVYSVKEVDSTGTRTALDLAGARLDKLTGKLLLMTGVTTKGSINLEIECKAGYVQPTATALGDWEEWNDLEQLCLRITQIMFQDYAQAVGRTGDKNIVQFTQHIVGFEMPADIADALRKYERLW